VKSPASQPAVVAERPPEGAAPPVADATALYAYRDAEGALLFYISRHDLPEGKQFYPYTWRAGRWQRKAWPAPRPLYGLPALAARPEAPVLVVEGEKCAEAANAALAAYACVSWPGGAAAVKQADWTALAGRSVTVWPDADAPGAKAAQAIMALLQPIAGQLYLIDPAGHHEGWDIADAVADGWSGEALDAWVFDNRQPVLPADVPRETSEAAAPGPSRARVGRPRPAREPVSVQGESTPCESAQFVSWKSLALSCTDNGAPHPTLANASLVIQQHPELQGKIRFDIFRQQIRTTFSGPEREWTDADDKNLTVWIQQRMKLNKLGLTTIKEAVEHAAGCNAFNSLTNWLSGLEWDREPRLATWVSDCLGVRIDPYSVAAGRNWLISMVARAFKPGCQADHMPVLEGRMGTGKSSLLELLGSPWFSALPEAFGSKDFFQAIQGQWLIEVPDMTGFSKREHSHIIAVITTRTDRYRASYGRRTENHPRQCVFSATSETDDYLQDSRGIRRYWPLRCQAIDLEAMAAQREQLFAEAVHEYRAGASWHEMPAEKTESEQVDRQNFDVWFDQIAAYCEGRERVTVTEVAGTCLYIEIPKQSQIDANRIAKCLKTLGYINTIERDGKQVRRVYRRGL